VVERRPDPELKIMDPISQKYIGKPFPMRSYEGRVALVIEVDKARYLKLLFEHTAARERSRASRTPPDFATLAGAEAEVRARHRGTSRPMPSTRKSFRIWDDGKLVLAGGGVLPVNTAAVFYATNVFEGFGPTGMRRTEELYAFRLAEHFARCGSP